PPRPAAAIPADDRVLIFLFPRPLICLQIQFFSGEYFIHLAHESVSDTRLSMHAAGRRCPDRPAASYQTRRRPPGKLPMAPGIRCRTGSIPAAFPAKRAKTLLYLNLSLHPIAPPSCARSEKVGCIFGRRRRFLRFPIGDRRGTRMRASVGNAGGNARPSLTNATLAASRLLHRRAPTAPCSKGALAAPPKSWPQFPPSAGAPAPHRAPARAQICD